MSKILNVLSEFDGLSSGQIALSRLGIKYNYFASEIEPQAIRVANKNFPNMINLGDVNNWKDWKLPKIDLMLAGSPCFVKGTLVLTSKGYKYIERLDENDYVLTHRNRYQKVINKMINISSDVYKLQTMSTDDILVTGDHPFYTRKMYRKWDNKSRKYVRKFDKPKWVNTNKLSKEFYLGIAINQKSELPIWNGITSKTNENSIKFINTLDFNNENFWWIVGRYLGDGWITKYKRKDRKDSYSYGVKICCSKIKNEKEDIRNRLKNLFNFSISEERTTYRFSIYNEELYYYLEQFGNSASNKELTGDILNLPKNLLESFLEGYLSADGSFNKTTNVISCSSVSKKLIYGIGQIIAKVYNRPFSIYKEFYKESTVIENRIVNIKPIYVLRFKKDLRKQDKAFYEDNYIWFPINNLTRENISTEVYNIEVENDNSYTVNNVIVHNCQDLSRVKKGNGLNGSKSKLFWQFLESYRYFKPTYFLLENVRMNEESENIISKELGVKPILLDSAYFSPQTRERLYWTNIPLTRLSEKCNLVLGDIIEKEVDEKYYYKEDFTFHSENKIVCATLHINGHDFLKRVGNPLYKCQTLTAVCGGNQHKKVLDRGRVRKLTPIEYERLQGLPNFEFSVNIPICIKDLVKNYANVDLKNPTELKNVLNVEKIKLQEFVQNVILNTHVKNQLKENIVLQNANMQTQKQIEKIKSIILKDILTIVNNVEKNVVNQNLKERDFALQNVFINITEEKIMLDGKEELLQKEIDFIPQKNGNNVSNMFGKETMENVRDVVRNLITKKDSNFTSITLFPLSMKNLEQIVIIYYLFVMSVIDGYIQKEIFPKNLLLNFNISEGYTSYGVNGNLISDSARYKMVGNGWEINTIMYLLQGLL